MKILLTGGLGYLGGRLSQYLNINHQVIIASRKDHDRPSWLTNGTIKKIDFTKDKELEQLCRGVDAIIHLAGMNAQECAANPAKALEVNGVLTGRILHSAIQAGVKRFIHFSTAHVYNSPLIGNITEETCPFNMHSYATSHRAGEDLVRAAHAKKEIDGIVVRLSNSFGAPVDVAANCWMLLVNDLCAQAIKTNKIVLNTSGEQKRDFVTITDTARAVEHLLSVNRDSLQDGVFNVGGDLSLSVYDMAQLVRERCQKITGKEISLSRREDLVSNKSDPLTYSIQKILSTGFKLNKNTEEEVDNTIHFCLKNIERL